ncbi:MAG TPA: hypothetical protein VHU13_04815 [Solirubrobacteraceae bacterium]|nr:hypothetical protein [Solirubrobacteraceae bacterium]
MGAEAARPGGAEQAAIREDPSGELRRSLRRLIAEGSALQARLLAGEETQIEGLESLERWRFSCLATVQSAFEQEAVAELVRASSSAPANARDGSPARMHCCRVRDAMELLEALESTLDRRGGRGERRPGSGARSAA